MSGPLNRAELALLDGRADAIVAELLAERRRQVSEEGYNPKHDERHRFEELAAAGAAYAASAASELLRLGQDGTKPVFADHEWRRWILGRLWPWWAEQFKPRDPRRDLVRAGALVIAALERLDRDLVVAGDVEAG